MPKFRDIPQFPRAYYRVDIGWDFLPKQLEDWNDPDNGSPVIMEPEFQRGHVWTKGQQIAYVEYMLKGGTTGKEIYFNCSSWMDGFNTPVYCVDGLQRITAALAFVNNDLPVFGGYRVNDFDGPVRGADLQFSVHMLKVKRKQELLKVYLDFNSGGTPHDPAEIARVASLMQDTPHEETL